MTAAKKPVKLQINQRGSWGNALRFDAADATVCGQVLDAANSLARAVEGVSMRIVTDDSLTQVLMRWRVDAGWQEVRSAL